MCNVLYPVTFKIKGLLASPNTGNSNLPAMKKIYHLLLAIAFLGQLLLPTAFGQSTNMPFPDVAGLERSALQKRLLGGQGTDGVAAFSVASNNFDIHFYQCNWTLNPEVRYISGHIAVHFTATEASDSIVLDLIKSLTVDSVHYQGSKIAFRQTDEHGLHIYWPATIGAGQKKVATIYYQGVPASHGFGNFYQGFHRESWSIFILSEPYGAAGWWPCKNGLTDKADSIDINVTVPAAYTVSTNGLHTSDVLSAAQKTSYFKHRYPIATYLVSLAISQYAVTEDKVILDGKQMPVMFYCFAPHVEYFKPATQQVIQCLPLFSELFGLYPFAKEKYAQTYWGLGGGMEHQTNSFIVDRWPNLVAHELGHQWFGNKVTCGSWQDLWLNEGFASFTELVYYEHLDPATYPKAVANFITNVTSKPDGSCWVPDTTDYSRLFGARLTYQKGGMVVHMLRWLLGDSTFYRAVRAYINDPALTYGYARTADLKRIVEKESGRNLDNFFTKWVYGEGYPSYQVTWSQNRNHWTTVKIKQTTSHPSVAFYDMPVPIRFKNASRDTIVVFNHQYSGQDFTVNLGFAADSVFFDPQLKLLSAKNTVTRETADQQANQVKLFPNPSPGKLFVTLKNPTDKKLQLRLFNNLGQLVYRRQLNLSGRDELLDIPLQNLARGIYILTIKGEKDIDITHKIMHR